MSFLGIMNFVISTLEYVVRLAQYQTYFFSSNIFQIIELWFNCYSHQSQMKMDFSCTFSPKIVHDNTQQPHYHVWHMNI